MSDLTTELRRWGEHAAVRYQRDAPDESAPGAHPLDRARDFAPGTRERAAKLLAGRDGRSRRVIQGRAAGLVVSPVWATDPIPCTETRTPGPPMAQFDRGVPPEYRWVDRAIAAISRTNPVRAAVLRYEFQVQVSQGVKARMVSEETGVGLSRWQYRRELALGLAYLDALRGRGA